MPGTGIGTGIAWRKGKGWKGGAPGPVGLLNTPEGSGAVAAFSLRKLSKSSVSAIRVRRSTDYAELDVGFKNGGLDVDALEGFVGNGNDGFVTTWYDQSGEGNHAVQTSASEQPQIVSNGEVILDGGLPSLKFNKTNNTNLNISDVSSIDGGVYTEFVTSSITSSDVDTGIVRAYLWDNIDNAWSYYYIYRENAIIVNGRDVAEVFQGVELSNPPLRSVISSTSNPAVDRIDLNVNGVFVDVNTLVDATPGNNTVVNLGYRNTTAHGGPFYFTGKIQEFVLYADIRSGTREQIEDNIINYYFEANV